MASRAVDALITYRIIKLLVTPFDRQEAFKYGIIDADGKVLKKSKTLKTERERKAYTVLHRFIFNLKLQYKINLQEIVLLLNLDL